MAVIRELGKIHKCLIINRLRFRPKLNSPFDPLKAMFLAYKSSPFIR